MCGKAKLFANKYGLKIKTSINELYEEARREHERICGIAARDKLSDARSKETIMYNELNRYAGLYGKEKRRTIICDRISEILAEAKKLDEGAAAMLRAGQQREMIGLHGAELLMVLRVRVLV